MEIPAELFKEIYERYTVCLYGERNFKYTRTAQLAKKYLLKYGGIEQLNAQFLAQHIEWRGDYLNLKQNQNFAMLALEMPNFIFECENLIFL
jgi:hypothetical protein